LTHIFIGFTALSYIKELTEIGIKLAFKPDKIKCVLTEIGIKVAFNSLLTIGRYLFSLKDQMNPQKKNPVHLSWTN